MAVGLIEIETDREPLYLVGRRSDGGKSGHDLALRCKRLLVNCTFPGFSCAVIGGKLEDGERITDALWNAITEVPCDSCIL